ncbi:hypothetical protein A3Q56_06800 [Intoshia linei]|uniref:Uncharacterized protein n=1 Tax=Intoshia linei TaxID=1819745 RepID=A0A177AU30_9BILA|nr:hypothetical protein A3Q56_06800 [Intoshia linei]
MYEKKDLKYELLHEPVFPKCGRLYKWYEERFRTKYLKNLHKNKPYRFLNAHDWKFIKSGTDDFRDGSPVKIDDSFIINKTGNCRPNILSHFSQILNKRLRSLSSKHVANLTNQEKFYMYQFPSKNRRTNYINQVIMSLMIHPLAIFPHLENSLPQNIFEDIVNLLDPDLIVCDFSGEVSSNEFKITSELDDDNDEFKGISDAISLEDKVYRWLTFAEKDNSDTFSKNVKNVPDEINQSKSHIKKVTRDFCEWVKSLGGDTNIDEKTLAGLFSSGYDVNPGMSSNIQVVDLCNVPTDLKDDGIKDQSNSKILNGKPQKAQMSIKKKKRNMASGMSIHLNGMK